MVEIDDSDNEEPVILKPSVSALASSAPEEEPAPPSSHKDDSDAEVVQADTNRDETQRDTDEEKPKPSSDDSEKERVADEMKKVLEDGKGETVCYHIRVTISSH